MHTQGEWKVEKYTVSGIVESYRVRMPNGYTASTSALDPDKKANAYLIAAAPDLLELLIEGEDIVSGLEAECDNAGIGDLVDIRDWWRKAEAVISKAKAVQS